ncbi:hypothetical protein KEM52_004720, partial [Ascosphaera acerosa]
MKAAVSTASAERAVVPQSDLELYRQYKRDAAVFSRGAEVRRSKARAELRSATGMTDEAIEGWAVMLRRDNARSARLEQAILLESGLGNRVDETGDESGGQDGSDEKGSRGKGSGGRGDARPPARGGSGSGPR